MTTSPDPDDSHPQDPPIHSELSHRSISARVRDEISRGVFANAAIVLSGPFEFAIDFILRLGKPDRLMTRVILAPQVAHQFHQTLQGSLKNFENQFGKIPDQPRPQQSTDKPDPGYVGTTGMDTPPENEPSEAPPAKPSIDDLYDELKIDDEQLDGTYANTVLIRHSHSEFCFDFVMNVYPRSTVTSRIYMTAQQVPPFCQALGHSLEQYRRKRQRPEE